MENGEEFVLFTVFLFELFGLCQWTAISAPIAYVMVLTKWDEYLPQR